METSISIESSPFLAKSLHATRHILRLLNTKEAYLYTYSSTQGAGGDVSLGADLASEKVYVEHLLDIASIDSEESGKISGAGSDYIVLDPLDGSDNFISHIPYYGSSLALCDKNGKVKEAIIYNFCQKSAVYANNRGVFYLDSIESSDVLNPLKVATTSKCGIFEKAYCNSEIAKKLYDKRLKFRSLGASALSLAKAYEVNFMLFVGAIREYDSKAGLFICQNLHIKCTNKYTLVSKDKHIFDMICNCLA